MKECGFRTTNSSTGATSRSILTAAGAGVAEAASVAHYLVRSDLVGHATTGMLRVKQCVEQNRKEQIVCHREPK